MRRIEVLARSTDPVTGDERFTEHLFCMSTDTTEDDAQLGRALKSALASMTRRPPVCGAPVRGVPIYCGDCDGCDAINAESDLLR